MAGQDDVRRIALSLPGRTEDKGWLRLQCREERRAEGFAWVWLERTEPKKPRTPLADHPPSGRDQAEKAALFAGDPERFFTEPHYNGFPAVLVRLPKVTRDQLHKLIVDAWWCQAPRQLVKDLAGMPAPRGARPVVMSTGHSCDR